jgi:dihydrofolate synthase/folylpolyglutamate synthase
MTYHEALAYLDSFINYERLDDYDYKKSMKLDRMRRLADLLGNPHMGIRSVHIAGTKGKGSTAAITHSILKNAGFKTGLYTSPHLISFRERIRIGDELISEDGLCLLLERVKSAVNRMAGERPSFFEVYTALAYLYFKEKKADFAVYETGLGGRLDATNIIEPLVVCITPVSHEHTDKLGATLGEIAREKAGIIKSGGLCVSAPQEEEALAVIRDVCRAKAARLILVGKDIIFEEISSSEAGEVFNIMSPFSEYPRLMSGLLGPHQILNAATAIGIIEALRLRGISVPADAVRDGLRAVRWEGRLEIVGRRPAIILDGAQNAASALTLAQAIKKIFSFRRLILMLGVSKDKDVAGILRGLLPISDSVILTKSKVAERALEPSRIKVWMDKDPAAKPEGVVLTSSVEEALASARRKAADDDLIVVTGSLFVVGEARKLICGQDMR